MLTLNSKALKIGNKWLNPINGSGPTPQPTIYHVTTSGSHGSVVASPTEGTTGTEVTLSNTPDSGYEFESYTLTGATLKNSNQFDIANSDVTVVGNFSQGYSFYQLEIDVPINGSWVSLCGANVRPYMGRIRNGSNYDSLTTADLDKIADTTPGNEYTKFINNSNISPGYLLLYFYGPLPNGELTWYDSLGSTVKSGSYTTAVLSGALDGGGYATLSQTGAITLTAGAQRVLHK